jgi:thioredoxin reductase (NADPH)
VATTHEYEVVIVGAGPAGMTAAMYAGRSMLKSVILEAGEPGGELLKTEVIEDYPGFEHVLGRDLAEKFASHAKKFGCEFREFTQVSSVRRRDDGRFETTATPTWDENDVHVFVSPTVIVTAGGTPVYLNVPGESEYAGKGVSYCAICDGAFFKGQTIAVIGGGDAAVEEADFLTRYAEKVYLVHRRGELRASKILQKRIFENPKVELVWNKTVDEISASSPRGSRGCGSATP